MTDSEFTQYLADKKRVEREVMNSIKYAEKQALAYDDDCSDIYYEEWVKAKKKGISKDRYWALNKQANKELREERVIEEGRRRQGMLLDSLRSA